VHDEIVDPDVDGPERVGIDLDADRGDVPPSDAHVVELLEKLLLAQDDGVA
jgi:hypothetical protein